MLDNKLKKLEEIIRGYGQMLVALSGGVDSSFLIAFAHKVYSEEGRPDAIAALTAAGPQFAEDEQCRAAALCDRLGIAHKSVDVSHITGMLKRNPVDRCYHCKREIFGMLRERADMAGSILCDGTNLDDMADYRPGSRAAEELGVASPLREAGLTKEDIRRGLRTFEDSAVRELADMPALACLATRIPYGEIITEEKLRAIEEAEIFLKSRGLRQVRVRCHEIAGRLSGNESRFMARIELLQEEMAKMLKFRSEAEEKLRSLGFRFVTMDLSGYERGKMNSLIESTEKPDRIKVRETVVRGNAANVEGGDIMEEIDRFLKEIREQKYSFGDFVSIIERLRQPDGCPWDREQTHLSLKKHLVEEANEALEAIDEGDRRHLCEELGDVLLQIVLHSQIAAENGDFTIDDVVQCASEKMIRRHPHVFGNIDVSGVDEGLDLWEEIKKREKTKAGG